MTETREDIMERLFPGYGDTKRALESYSDWELGLYMVFQRRAGILKRCQDFSYSWV